MPTYYTIYIILLALGVLTGAFRYSALSPGCRYFFVLLIITLVVEIAAWYLGDLWHSNLIVYRLLIPTQFGLITLGLSRELNTYRYATYMTVAFVLVIWTIEFIKSFSIFDQHYPTLVKTICNLLIIAWVLTYLFTLLQINTLESFTNFPFFWLSLGWLLFSVVNLSYFATVNYLSLPGQRFLHVFNNIRIISNFVLYTLFIIAFLTKQMTLQKVL